MRKMLADMTLPYPPSLNHYWRMNRGRVHISEEGEKYLRLIRQLAFINGKSLYQDRFFLKKMAEVSGKKQQLRVNAVFYLPDNARRDLDNLFKVIFDCMTKTGIWLDDSQVFEIRSSKILKRDHGSISGGQVSMQVFSIYDPEEVQNDEL